MIADAPFPKTTFAKCLAGWMVPLPMHSSHWRTPFKPTYRLMVSVRFGLL
jgi:hypothetical protein